MEDGSILKAQTILVYAANKNEVDLTWFVNQMWQMGKQVAFPLCRGESMDFFEVTSYDQLESGAFGILEPKGLKQPIVPNASTLVCVPGIAFSDDGNRIGMGRGYYDRYFQRYPFVYKIGLAYEFQLCPPWTPDYCDIGMDRIITEQRDIILK